ncbi:unnamed protein product [Schistocephalus solidus]|uniref:Uncharacterized protein n=1 Tax=Schistocephalus solidus TaxID=70667 RepID=A0A183T0B2_SCHSO|nr:unnamed protein product [Schistocephalus solidus]
MDDRRLPKRRFYGDFATGARRQGGHKLRYKDTLKKSLKQLQINPVTYSYALTPGINSIIPTIIQTTSLYSSPVTHTTATTTAFAFTTTTTTVSDGESLLNCPQCDRTFTSRICPLNLQLTVPIPPFHVYGKKTGDLKPCAMIVHTFTWAELMDKSRT